MIQAVVFDLDGTLANTAHLRSGRRAPADVLGLCPPGADPAPISYGTRVTALPGRLLARGFRVVVITRSPWAYAATLLGLLRIDYCNLHASVRPGAIAAQLRFIAQSADLVDGLELLYIGDQPHDEHAARQAGVAYQQAPWINANDHQLADLPPSPQRCWLPLGTEPADHEAPAGEIDIAVAALRQQHDPTALPLLLERGYLSAVREYSDPAHIEDPALRADIAPWVLLTNDDWADIINTGDIGRLLDISPHAIRRRLPDAALDKSVAHQAANGAYQTTIDTLDNLPPDVAGRIRRPHRSSHPIDQVRRAVRTAASVPPDVIDQLAATDDLNPSEVAALCYLTLLATPHQKRRRQLQHLALDNMPPGARDCAIRRAYEQGWVGFPPEFITRNEIDTDPDTRTRYHATLRNLFPLHRISPSNSAPRLTTLAAVPYKNCHWGDELWIAAKNWHGEHSGEEPVTSLLDLPAAVLGAHLAHDPPASIVPAPATPYSPDQPAQASQRLAHTAATAADRPLLELLTKHGSEIRCTRPGQGSTVVLVDDQITKGTTTARSAAALRDNGWNVDTVYAWSASRPTFREPSGNPTDGCWLAHAAEQLGLIANCNTRHHNQTDR